MPLDARRLLLALLLALTWSACGNDDPDAGPVSVASATPQTTPAAACCPTHITVGFGQPGTDLDIGTTGINYDFSFPEGVGLGLALSCDGSEGTCGTCRATSVDTNRRRCFDDMSRPCTTNADCPTGACTTFFAPPVPVSAGGVPACHLIELLDASDATFEPASGPLTLRWTFFVGIDLGIPCPRCSGATLGDTGTCDDGPRVGAACTVDAHDPLFGSTSFDCPPVPIANVGGFALRTPLTTGVSTLASRSKCVGDRRDLDCYCPDQLLPNACTDVRCAPTGDGDFACPDGPFDGACRAEPYRACRGDFECPAPGDSCAFRVRECLGEADHANGVLAPVTRVGTAGATHGVLVAAHCLGLGSSVAGNVGLGLPSAASWRLPYRLDATPACRVP